MDASIGAKNLKVAMRLKTAWSIFLLAFGFLSFRSQHFCRSRRLDSRLSKLSPVLASARLNHLPRYLRFAYLGLRWKRTLEWRTKSQVALLSKSLTQRLALYIQSSLEPQAKIYTAEIILPSLLLPNLNRIHSFKRRCQPQMSLSLAQRN
jgi:hypothetical protein